MNVSFIHQVIDHNQESRFRNRNLRYSMATNGTILNRYLYLIVKNNINILVGLDGDKKNNSYRIYNNGKNSYEHIIEGIKFIQNKFPEFYENNVNFNAVLHNRNSVEEIYSFFKRHLTKFSV